MSMNEQATSYRNHRFSISIVARAIWLYFHFNLSLREVEKMMLKRGVDQDGYERDEIVQARRNAKAAKRLLVRFLKKQGCAPKRIVIDKLRFYSAARRQVIPQFDHRSNKGLNLRSLCSDWCIASLEFLTMLSIKNYICI